MSPSPGSTNQTPWRQIPRVQAWNEVTQRLYGKRRVVWDLSTAIVSGLIRIFRLRARFVGAWGLEREFHRDVQGIEIVILLATYSGERFIEPQIKSFGDNNVRFTLHWLDDHSTDSTRKRVRSSATSAGITLKEWHQPNHLGVPAAFFRLLECVEADIYLFSDQDDLWQPGKIDATVTALLPNLTRAALCFSDPLTFERANSDSARSFFELLGIRTHPMRDEPRLFMTVFQGNTQGFTCEVREVFLSPRDIACDYAFMHDLWIYNVAAVSGTVQLLSGTPTVLYRLHDNNTSRSFGSWRSKRRIVISWNQYQKYRRGLARHAQGFILASSTFPRGPKVDRAVAVARLFATLDRRQSLAAVARLLRLGVLWPAWRLSLGLATACLFSDARG